MTEDTQLKELTELYGTYGDEELRQLALTFNDLTDVAQQALKVEFAHRSITMPSPGKPEPVPSHVLIDAGKDSTFEFNDLEDAYLAQSVLRSAGIESLVPTSELGTIDVPRLIVAPGDANAAQLILSRPTHHASEEEAAFVEPACPKCGTADPLLESVEPTNQWRCESCGEVWSDPPLS
jgi:hypothetical protein